MPPEAPPTPPPIPRAPSHPSAPCARIRRLLPRRSLRPRLRSPRRPLGLHHRLLPRSRRCPPSPLPVPVLVPVPVSVPVLSPTPVPTGARTCGGRARPTWASTCRSRRSLRHILRARARRSSSPLARGQRGHSNAPTGRLLWAEFISAVRSSLSQMPESVRRQSRSSARTIRSTPNYLHRVRPSTTAAVLASADHDPPIWRRTQRSDDRSGTKKSAAEALGGAEGGRQRGIGCPLAPRTLVQLRPFEARERQRQQVVARSYPRTAVHNHRPFASRPELLVPSRQLVSLRGSSPRAPPGSR